MAIITCSNCNSRIKVPDTLNKSVPCPKCKELIPPPAKAAPSKPAFEVVEDEPALPSRPTAKPPTQPIAKPAPRPAPKPTPQQLPLDDIEILDEEPAPVAKRGRADEAEPIMARIARPSTDYDDEEDRPRSRRSRDDDDEDDLPRARSRRSRDDDYDDLPRARSRRSRDEDDYEDDRPRRNSRSRDDNYEEDYDRPLNSKGAPYRYASIGTLLISISFWLYLGVFGFWSLGILILWVGSEPPRILGLFAGLLGVGNWIVGAVGVGFCQAGPKKAKGAALTAAIVSGIHLLFVFGIFADLQWNVMSSSKGRGNDVMGLGLGRVDFALALFASTTMLWAVDMMLPVLIEFSRIFGTILIACLTGALEIARLLILLNMLKAYARASWDYGAESFAAMGLKIVGVTCAGIALLVALVVVICFESKYLPLTLFNALALLIFLIYTAMMIVPALAAQATRKSLAMKAK